MRRNSNWEPLYKRQSKTSRSTILIVQNSVCSVVPAARPRPQALHPNIENRPSFHADGPVETFARDCATLRPAVCGSVCADAGPIVSDCGTLFSNYIWSRPQPHFHADVNKSRCGNAACIPALTGAYSRHPFSGFIQIIRHPRLRSFCKPSDIKRG